MDVRHSRVEALEIALGKLLAEERFGRARHEQLRSQHGQLLQQLQNAMFTDQNPGKAAEVDMVLSGFLRSSLKANEAETARVQVILNELARQINTRRTELINAHQAEEVLVTLKRKQDELFLNEQKVKEASLQDDVYIAQSFRQRKQAEAGNHQ